MYGRGFNERETMSNHKIATGEEWLAARVELSGIPILLRKEKRPSFPWVKFAFVLCAATIVGRGILAAEAQRSAAAKPTSGYLDVGGSKIYYETRGSGPAIVLLHDGLLSGVTWDEVWEPLGTKHEVIRYDRRAYGRSELPTSSYSSTEDLRKTYGSF